MNSSPPCRHWASPIARCTDSMPRTERSSMPFDVIALAARRALRRASSSRMRLDSSVLWPVMNCGRPPGWVELSSMRVRALSSKWSSGDRPPTFSSSSRQRRHTGSAMLPATTFGSPRLSL